MKDKLSHSETIWYPCFLHSHSFPPNKSTAWIRQLLGPAGRGWSQQCVVVEHHVISLRWFNAAPLLQDGGCHIRLCHGAACHPFIRAASNGIPFLCVPGDWARLGLTASQIHTENNTQTLWWIHLLGLSLPRGPMVNRNALNTTAMLRCCCPLGPLIAWKGRIIFWTMSH